MFLQRRTILDLRDKELDDMGTYTVQVFKDRYEEELNILEAWLSGCEEQVSPMIQVA